MPTPTLRPTGDKLLKAISSGMLALYGDHYGRPPVQAKTFLNDNILTCVLQEEVFTQGEVDDVQGGADDFVLTGRVTFQREHQAEFVAMVERLTGRKVKTFLSANQTRPGVAAELFILDH